MALSRSQSLEILSDVVDRHHLHGPQAFATRTNVGHIMEAVPQLHTLTTHARVWQVRLFPRNYFRSHL